MAERFPELTPKLVDFIENQHLFFVGTCGDDTSVNISPKGLDTLRVLGPNRVLWLNLTGSGNETAAHLRENSRMTLMFCSFDRQPLILRAGGGDSPERRHLGGADRAFPRIHRRPAAVRYGSRSGADILRLRSAVLRPERPAPHADKVEREERARRGGRLLAGEEHLEPGRQGDRHLIFRKERSAAPGTPIAAMGRSYTACIAAFERRCRHSVSSSLLPA